MSMRQKYFVAQKKIKKGLKRFEIGSEKKRDSIMKSFFYVFAVCPLILGTFHIMAAEGEPDDILNLKGPTGSILLVSQKHLDFIKQSETRKNDKSAVWHDVMKPPRRGTENSHPATVEYSWTLPPDADRACFVIAGGGDVIRQDVTGKNHVSIGNLKIGCSYICCIEVRLKNGKLIRKGVALYTRDQVPRWIRMPDASNVRDIGGWKTADGKYKIRQGLLYRGGEFDKGARLTAEGERVIAEVLKLKTDIDLRTFWGIEGGLSEYPLKKMGVRQILLPFSPTDYGKPGSKKNIAALFHLLADRSIYPAYCHCAGGADRTGAAMFLLEAVLGLADEDLFTEYELTSFSKYGKRTRNGKIFQILIRKLNEYGSGSDPYRKKAEAYLLDIGVPRADLESLRNIFLEKIFQ